MTKPSPISSVAVIVGGLIFLLVGGLGLILIVTVSVPSAVVAAVTRSKQSDDIKVAPPSNVPGIDPVLMDAINKAVAKTAKTCKGMRWQVLAGVGQIESHLAQGVTIARNGDTDPHIVGIPIGPDTDHGKWDGDKTRDHAVGVLQIIPASWKSYGADGNGDGIKDPNNVYDNALGSARHLCGTAHGIDLGTGAGLSKALYAYNHSDTYVSQVAAAIHDFDTQYSGGDAGSGGVAGKAGPLAAKAIAAAKAELGTPYSFGGGTPEGPTIGRTAPAGWDCSSYVQMAYWKASGGKIMLPRTTYDQMASSLVAPVPMPDIQPGDLIFVQDGILAGFGHVIMYLGGGKIIEEPHTGAVARIMPLAEYQGMTMAARRVKTVSA